MSVHTATTREKHRLKQEPLKIYTLVLQLRLTRTYLWHFSTYINILFLYKIIRLIPHTLDLHVLGLALLFVLLLVFLLLTLLIFLTSTSLAYFLISRFLLLISFLFSLTSYFFLILSYLLFLTSSYINIFIKSFKYSYAFLNI